MCPLVLPFAVGRAVAVTSSQPGECPSAQCWVWGQGTGWSHGRETLCSRQRRAAAPLRGASLSAAVCWHCSDQRPGLDLPGSTKPVAEGFGPGCSALCPSQHLGGFLFPKRAQRRAQRRGKPFGAQNSDADGLAAASGTRVRQPGALLTTLLLGALVDAQS